MSPYLEENGTATVHRHQAKDTPRVTPPSPQSEKRPDGVADSKTVSPGIFEDNERHEPERAPLRTVFPALELEEHAVDEHESRRAIVVGAGPAGITAGILLQHKVPGLDLTILERNSDVGGVWNSNIYPGVRCDVPSDVYQTTFSPKTDWSANYGRGAEIKAYWKGLVAKYNLGNTIQLSHRVLEARWSEALAKWQIRVEHLGAVRVEEADFLITATGHFSDPRLPSYPGIETFQGHLRHTSNYDPAFDAAGKRVAVIGNGASGIQVLPQLQKVAKSLDHYARSPTWIAGSFGGEKIPPSTSDSRELAPQDAQGYTQFRKSIENKSFDRFSIIFKDQLPNKKARETFQGLMAARLGDKRDELLDAVTPSFSPNCRRLTPGPGIATPGYPNLFFLLGPNSTGPGGTLPHSLENSVTYIAKVLRKVSSQRIRTIQPTEAATRDFRAYCESFFPRTVMSENCSSWYNGGINGGRIHGIWPGSGSHLNIVRRQVRWEDYEYTYLNRQGNRFGYFGNGWSVKDIQAAELATSKQETTGEDGEREVDFSSYLKPEAVDGKLDLRDYHESWWDL
ncbi:putative sterigmatocystin biosynthesis monooxygenase stcW [Cyphellophora attinorum]|uniref:Putative sterigmatocystin biosynthesis monooxygenase stcW n=1 Tax=Cyphellophora attinorum TaxID=1664694 RepID=A0A0N1HB18_9EURO|nr:putative sterigmatocystin biosynthesis monooxygenase stcW [Phialophora attinorum]KPI40175.1 putative sterigmatocystin biosynthesis monooxygenase stcW [Phialophora attinorum]